MGATPTSACARRLCISWATQRRSNCIFQVLQEHVGSEADLVSTLHRSEPGARHSSPRSSHARASQASCETEPRTCLYMFARNGQTVKQDLVGSMSATSHRSRPLAAKLAQLFHTLTVSLIPASQASCWHGHPWGPCNLQPTPAEHPSLTQFHSPTAVSRLPGAGIARKSGACEAPSGNSLSRPTAARGSSPV